MKQLVRLNTRPSSDGESFTYVLRYTDTDGRRRWKTLGHADRRRAEKQRAETAKELRMARVEPASMSLREFARDSLARTGDQIRESTRIDYQSAMEDLIVQAGNLDFRRICLAHGEQFRQARLDLGDSPATVAKKLRSLKRVFQLAVERKQLDENPLRYVKAPRVPKQKIRVYTREECDRLVKAASEVQHDSILEWDLVITVALTTGMRKGELLNLVWSDIDFAELVVEVNPNPNGDQTWEWRIKDTDRRLLPLTEDVCRLLIALQESRPRGYPYVFVPPARYDHIQQVLRPKGMWSLSSARNKIIHNFSTQFEKILAKANVPTGTFHDLRKTAITNWFRQGLSEYDVMVLAGHANFQTTHRFYLAVADDLIPRARRAITHEVRPELIEKCSRRRPCPTV